MSTPPITPEPWPGRQYVTPPRSPRQTQWPLIIGGVAAALAIAFGGLLVIRGTGIVPADVPIATAAPATAAPKADGPPRVADLMKQLGCANAAVIGTQLYSRETGRCTAAGGSITIASFESTRLRDQWVAAGKQFGGSIVVGDGWALFAEGPDDADAAAAKLGGVKA